LEGRVLDRFLTLAGDRLRGDWVLIGGMVLPLVGIEHRVTMDIDLAGPEGNQQTLELLQLAAEIGLPPEAVNQAAGYFLHGIPGWADHLIRVRSGRTATFHRPDATLYLLLKVPRLSPTDLQDCLLYLDHARRAGEPFDAEAVRSVIATDLAGAPTAARRDRLRALLRAIDA